MRSLPTDGCASNEPGDKLLTAALNQVDSYAEVDNAHQQQHIVGDCARRHAWLQQCGNAKPPSETATKSSMNALDASFDALLAIVGGC